MPLALSRAAAPILTTLLSVLRDQNLLLLLDNCEHLIETCAHLAEDVLRSCPGVRILATSREGLGIPGEIVWSLRSLPVQPADWQPALPTAGNGAFGEFAAVQLFLERARAAEPTFQIADFGHSSDRSDLSTGRWDTARY